jgi:hypothetical protein
VFKDLRYYLTLRYQLEIQPLNDGKDGFHAYYPQLGANGSANSILGAVRTADADKERRLRSMLERRVRIPEPDGRPVRRRNFHRVARLGG